MKTVTIITSAYNAEQTIERTISSVRNQTYPHFEYLLINHGSTDGTGELIAESCAADARLKAITIEENTGFIGRALNIGLKQASGEYICFLDADDIYEKDFLEVMLDNMLQSECDVGICGFSFFSEKEERIVHTFLQQNRQLISHEDYRRYFQEEFIRKLCFSNNDYYWNKCYRVEYLKKYNFSFSETKFFLLDAVFNLEILKTKPKITIIPVSGIVCTLSDKSTSSNWKKGMKTEILDYVQMWQNYLTEFLPENIVLDRMNQYMPCINDFGKLANADTPYEDLIQELSSWLSDGREIYHKLLKASRYSRRYLNEIEHAMMALKMKSCKMEDYENSIFEKYYSKYLLEEDAEACLKEIFQFIWHKENIFSLGSQELTDMIL